MRLRPILAPRPSLLIGHLLDRGRRLCERHESALQIVCVRLQLRVVVVLLQLRGELHGPGLRRFEAILCYHLFDPLVTLLLSNKKEIGNIFLKPVQEFQLLSGYIA